MQVWQQSWSQVVSRQKQAAAGGTGSGHCCRHCHGCCCRRRHQMPVAATGLAAGARIRSKCRPVAAAAADPPVGAPGPAQECHWEGQTVLGPLLPQRSETKRQGAAGWVHHRGQTAVALAPCRPPLLQPPRRACGAVPSLPARLQCVVAPCRVPEACASARQARSTASLPGSARQGTQPANLRGTGCSD